MLEEYVAFPTHLHVRIYACIQVLRSSSIRETHSRIHAYYHLWIRSPTLVEITHLFSLDQFRGYHPISLQLAEVLKITKFTKRPQEEESTDEQITKTEEIKEDAAWCLVWRFIPVNLVLFATFDPSTYPITNVHFPEILNKWNLKTLVFHVFPNQKNLQNFQGGMNFNLHVWGGLNMQKKTSRGLMYTKYVTRRLYGCFQKYGKTL